jgi:hypothetical protein
MTDHSDARRSRIEIAGLGLGVGGAQRVWLDGVEQPNATVIMDLHSDLRVRIGDRMYSESDADITVVDAKTGAHD